MEIAISFTKKIKTKSNKINLFYGAVSIKTKL